MKIAIGSDHGGYELKEHIKKHLMDNKIEAEDFGTNTTESCDYPDYAFKVGEAVASGGYDKGILICGTGIGVSIAANKVKGVRAALCSEPYSARLSREHNDANVLCLGGRIIGTALALEIVDAWLKGEFAGGRHARRVDKISGFENG